MTPYLFIFFAVLFFSLSAWLAKMVYDMGTAVGKSIGNHLLWMSYSGVASLALWPMAKEPLSLPPIASTAIAAEPEEMYYVGLAVDEKQEYHALGCPDVPQFFKWPTQQAARDFGRHPHSGCIHQTAASMPGP